MRPNPNKEKQTWSADLEKAFQGFIAKGCKPEQLESHQRAVKDERKWLRMRGES